MAACRDGLNFSPPGSSSARRASQSTPLGKSKVVPQESDQEGHENPVGQSVYFVPEAGKYIRREAHEKAQGHEETYKDPNGPAQLLPIGISRNDKFLLGFHDNSLKHHEFASAGLALVRGSDSIMTRVRGRDMA